MEPNKTIAKKVRASSDESSNEFKNKKAVGLMFKENILEETHSFLPSSIWLHPPAIRSARIFRLFLLNR
jgi:hypothetical protein